MKNCEFEPYRITTKQERQRLSPPTTTISRVFSPITLTSCTARIAVFLLLDCSYSPTHTAGRITNIIYTSCCYVTAVTPMAPSLSSYYSLSLNPATPQTPLSTFTSTVLLTTV